LRNVTNCNFLVDPKVIAAGTVPVNLQVKEMKVHHVLNHLMRICQLRFQLRDEAIYITALDTAEEDTAEDK
jgi:hypothetical protein